MTDRTREEWPELVGGDGSAAADRIRRDRPELHPELVPDGAFVTMEYREHRVRVFVDADGRVARTPRVG
ncbi:serine protease inhibitor (plasmid) [Streptomyces sp. BI20]|uniref:serine protease inhibitor n=1 Tax=Streptomyces sp. BI20 TaxID=3403460 RepID=UPI003C75E6DD